MPELDKSTIKAISAETRQEMLKMLSKRPYTASEIAKILGKHVTTVAEHLSVLEKSGLVAKKDTKNKWIYYTLTEKGGGIFKPQYYSWVIVLSVSIVGLFAGMNQFTFFAQKSLEAATPGMAMPAAYPDAIGIALVFLGILGITLALAKILRTYMNRREFLDFNI